MVIFPPGHRILISKYQAFSRFLQRQLFKLIDLTYNFYSLIPEKLRTFRGGKISLKKNNHIIVDSGRYSEIS